jgi:hypothetical protein
MRVEEDVVNELPVKIKPSRKKGSSAIQVSPPAKIYFEGEEKDDDDVDESPSKIQYLFGKFKRS